jgi:hypothetical protein
MSKRLGGIEFGLVRGRVTVEVDIGHLAYTGCVWGLF